MKSVRYTYRTSIGSGDCYQALVEALDMQSKQKESQAGMIVGDIRANHIYLHRGFEMGSAFNPILSADIEDLNGGAIITGYFRIHWSSKIFSWIVLSVVSAFSILFAYFIALAGSSDDSSSWLIWVSLLIPIVPCMLLWGVIILSSRISDSKTEVIRRFIEDSITNKQNKSQHPTASS